jgi:hypothetical protein
MAKQRSQDLKLLIVQQVFSTSSSSFYHTFKYTTFKYDNMHVIPVTLTQDASTVIGGGTAQKPKATPTNNKKHVLGRDRKIYIQGRKQYVIYQRKLIERNKKTQILK